MDDYEAYMNDKLNGFPTSSMGYKKIERDEFNSIGGALIQTRKPFYDSMAKIPPQDSGVSIVAGAMGSYKPKSPVPPGWTFEAYSGMFGMARYKNFHGETMDVKNENELPEVPLWYDDDDLVPAIGANPQYYLSMIDKPEKKEKWWNRTSSHTGAR